MFIRALHLIAGFLARQTPIQHLPRKYTSSILERKNEALKTSLWSPAQENWLANPVADWGLSTTLLAEVDEQCKQLM